MSPRKSHRQYQNNYPSVTQVLDVLRKPGLEQWFKANTIQFITEESKKGREIGTQIHEAIQSHIEAREVQVKTEYADEVMNALKSFMLFKKEHPEFELIKSEMPMTSERHGFNGTMDAVAKLPGAFVGIDWKSGKAGEDESPKIYDEYIYQLSAYIILYNEVNNADIHEGYVLTFAKDKVAYNIQKIEQQQIKESFEEVFLSALKILNYKRKG